MGIWYISYGLIFLSCYSNNFFAWLLFLWCGFHLGRFWFALSLTLDLHHISLIALMKILRQVAISKLLWNLQAVVPTVINDDLFCSHHPVSYPIETYLFVFGLNYLRAMIFLDNIWVSGGNFGWQPEKLSLLWSWQTTFNWANFIA